MPNIVLEYFPHKDGLTIKFRCDDAQFRREQYIALLASTRMKYDRLGDHADLLLIKCGAVDVIEGPGKDRRLVFLKKKHAESVKKWLPWGVYRGHRGIRKGQGAIVDCEVEFSPNEWRMALDRQHYALCSRQPDDDPKPTASAAKTKGRKWWKFW